MASEKNAGGGRRLQGPKGTRDFYPEEMLRRRYITKLWRDTAIRHGFDEVEGPMFETSELYAVKSGEGILGELFQAYSGKSPEEVAQVRERGRAPFAMRPEFTPTLARMVAARAAQLPKPTKWFMIGSFFRAERPQRGRLREFLQWNCDVIGLPEGGEAIRAESVEDAGLMTVSVDALAAFGMTPERVRARFTDRRFVAGVLRGRGVADEHVDGWLGILDRLGKVGIEKSVAAGVELGTPAAVAQRVINGVVEKKAGIVDNERVVEELASAVAGMDDAQRSAMNERVRDLMAIAVTLRAVNDESRVQGAEAWLTQDNSIVRGLAYYTGTVFELLADGERAIAGGGRYDNLIELLGGPPTPAVGFAMGDVVLGLLLEESGLMPEGRALREALSRPGASLRPDVFVISPDDSKDGEVRRLVAQLRRGVESEAWLSREGRKPWDADRYAVRPLHARRSYKSTRNIGKLLKDAAGQSARVVVILEGDGSATLKDLDSGREACGVDPASVGRALAGVAGGVGGDVGGGGGAGG